jgi:uncharacterized protein YutE (UPF0331/DUF86 family)
MMTHVDTVSRETKAEREAVERALSQLLTPDPTAESDVREDAMYAVQALLDYCDAIVRELAEQD